MNRREWIVCERDGGWAAALRLVIDRADWSARRRPRLFEVRQLVELSARLDARPDSLILVEARQSNFAKLLVWLSEAGRWYPAAHFAALVDRTLWASHGVTPQRCRHDRQQVAEALREAGASEVVASPRQLRGILALDRQHANQSTIYRVSPPAETSITTRAWASLPWQVE